MNRKTKILSISSLLLGLTFGFTSCSCEANQVPSEDNTETNNLPYEEPTKDRTITFKETKGLTQGSFIDLNEIVEVNPGINESFDERQDLSFDYELLGDGLTPPKVQTFTLQNSTPSVLKSKTLALLRPGKQVLRIKSKNATAYLELDIAKNTKYQTILDAYSKDIVNFEISKQITFDENMKLQDLASKQTLIQKAENYYFNPSELMGIAVNLGTNTGYYYRYNEKLDKPLRVSPNGEYNSLLTAQSFHQSFGSFKEIFSETNLQFEPVVNELFGEEYSYCLPYLEETEQIYLKALNLLGLRQNEKINGKTYYRTHLIPKVNFNNELEIYSVLLSNSGNAYLEGPYKIENVGKVKIPVVEEFVSSRGLNITPDASFLTNKLSTYKNYTLKSEGHFEDLNGNKIEDVQYFTGFLDTFDLTIKATDNALYFSDISRIDGSNDKEAILKDIPVQGSFETYKYVKNGNTYVKEESPVKDPYSGSIVTGWQNSSTFGNYRPALAFGADSYKYANYIDNGSNNYSIIGLNDIGANNAMKQFIRAIAYDKLVSDGSPISYYISAGYMDIKLGENATDDISCNFRVRLSTNTYYVYYCLKLDVTSINTTSISI